MTMIEKTWPITEKLILNALHLTGQLYEQLAREADALKKPLHTELINDIATSKKQLVAQLEQFNMQCGQILATEKLPNDQEGIKEYFQRAEAAELRAVESINNWAQIQFICSECRTLNEQNGAGIELLAHHTKRSLHILKGKPHITNTYGPDGATQSDRFTHTLISV
ncbi:MAG: flagella synthesis protein FlgN [Methylobacter sp.]